MLQLTIKSGDLTVNCYGTATSIPIKAGYDLKETIFAEKLISYIVRSRKINVTISYIEQDELKKLEEMFYYNAWIDIYTEIGEVYSGVILGEGLDYSKNPNYIENVNYYSLNFTVEG